MNKESLYNSFYKGAEFEKLANSLVISNDIPFDNEQNLMKTTTTSFIKNIHKIHEPKAIEIKDSPARKIPDRLDTPYPDEFFCKTCNKISTSVIQYEIGKGTWLACYILSCTGCYLCCFCPFLIDSCKDKIHKCPDCDAYVGKKPYLFKGEDNNDEI